jgi:hypothetical protein
VPSPLQVPETTLSGTEISSTQSIESPLRIDNEQAQLAVYRGPNPFSLYATGSEFPMFEVNYDPDLWEYINGEPFGPVLVHRDIDNCSMTLYLPPQSGAEKIGAAQLAGEEWSVYAAHIVSSFDKFFVLPYEDIAFSFMLFLPEEFSFEEKGTCQQDIEKVINTFSIIVD